MKYLEIALQKLNFQYGSLHTYAFNAVCLQCFDTVGWVSGRASSLQKLSDEVYRVGVVNCLERGAYCLHMVQLMPLLHKIPSPLASFEPRVVLSFWYHYQVALEKRLLNGCSSISCAYDF